MSRINRAVLNAQERMDYIDFVSWLDGRMKLHITQEQDNERTSKITAGPDQAAEHGTEEVRS